jgi:hypothetical protein
VTPFRKLVSCCGVLTTLQERFASRRPATSSNILAKGHSRACVCHHQQMSMHCTACDLASHFCE